MPTQRRIDKMSQVLKHRQPDLTVICENIHDPHNVSAILRSCDAVGVQQIHLLYTNTEFPELGKKSSASAKKWIETESFTDPRHLQVHLKQNGYMIYATRLSPGARSIFDVDWTVPSAIILGNEHTGVSDEALAIADDIIYIPMFGMIQSLNVSVATAVILYEACRQRMLGGRYPFPEISPEELFQQLEKWKQK